MPSSHSPAQSDLSDSSSASSHRADHMHRPDAASSAQAAHGDLSTASQSHDDHKKPSLPNGVITGTGRTQAAFVHKLFSMVQDPPETSDEPQPLIAWSRNGETFAVNNPVEFSRTILPQWFKHNNWQSFVRQLNMYGFHKVNDVLATTVDSGGSSAWEFQHTHFRRNRDDLLQLIKRKSNKMQTAGSHQSSAQFGQLPSSKVSTPMHALAASGMSMSPKPGRRILHSPQEGGPIPTGFPPPSLGMAGRPGSSIGAHVDESYRGPLYAPPIFSHTVPPSFAHLTSPTMALLPHPSDSQSSPPVAQFEAMQRELERLGEALYRTRQETLAGKQETSLLLKMILNLLCGIIEAPLAGGNDEARMMKMKEEVAAAKDALAKLDHNYSATHGPDPSAALRPPSATSTQSGPLSWPTFSRLVGNQNAPSTEWRSISGAVSGAVAGAAPYWGGPRSHPISGGDAPEWRPSASSTTVGGGGGGGGSSSGGSGGSSNENGLSRVRRGSVPENSSHSTPTNKFQLPPIRAFFDHVERRGSSEADSAATASAALSASVPLHRNGSVRKFEEDGDHDFSVKRSRH